MIAFAAFLVIFHLFLFLVCCTAMYRERAMGQKPSMRNLVAVFVFFILTAGYLWLAFHQPSWAFFLFVVEVMVSLLDLTYLQLF